MESELEGNDKFEGGIEKERVKNSEIVDELTCPICQRLLWNPVSCKNCENHFCSGCIDTWFRHNNQNMCPNKCIYMKKKPAPILLSLISKLEIKCMNNARGCSAIVPYDALHKHELTCEFTESQCEFCLVKMLQKEKTGHLEVCEAVLIECEICKEKVKRSEFGKKDKLTCLAKKIENLETTFTNRLQKQEKKHKEQVKALQKKVLTLESVLKRTQSMDCPVEGEVNLENDPTDQSDLNLGIHRNISLKGLLYSGYEVVYNKGYDHRTTNEELEDILEAYTIDSEDSYNILVCVGAINEGEDADNIILCGIDYLQVALRKTKSLYEAKIGSNSIYWYWLEEKSFGFSPKKPIWLSCADHAEKYNNTMRLSWCVHGTCGGSRLGKFSGLTEAHYKKLILVKVLE